MNHRRLDEGTKHSNPSYPLGVKALAGFTWRSSPSLAGVAPRPPSQALQPSDLFAGELAPRGAAMPETHTRHPCPKRESSFHMFLRHASVSLSPHKTQEHRIRTFEPIGAHVPSPARQPFQKPALMSGQYAGAMLAASMADPLSQPEASLRVGRGYTGVPLS